MYDKTSLGILKEVYITPGIHKRALAKNLGLSMPSIEYALKKIGNLLKKQKSGNQIKFFLNYSKEALTPALTVVEHARLQSLPPKIRLAAKDFLKELEEKPVISVIFGSYAKGNYIPNSDIDILLVYTKIGNIKKIEETARKISLKTSTKISPVYLGYKEFRVSCHDSTKEFFKNLKNNKIILTGIEWWRQLMDEET